MAATTTICCCHFCRRQYCASFDSFSQCVILKQANDRGKAGAGAFASYHLRDCQNIGRSSSKLRLDPVTMKAAAAVFDYNLQYEPDPSNEPNASPA